MRKTNLTSAFVPVLLIVACGLLMAGCETTRLAPEDTMQARIFLEADEGEAGIKYTLPLSGSTLRVATKPIFGEFDVVDAEVVRVDLGNCLMLVMTPAASRDLYRQSVAHQGRRFVLTLNDRAIGARMIDGPIYEGALLVFVEIPDAELPDVVRRLQLTAAAIHKLKRS